MNDQNDSHRETKQTRLGHFLRIEEPISFMEDKELKLRYRAHKSWGVIDYLMVRIFEIVKRHPKGIADDKLVEELWNRGCDCISPVIHRAGKKLVDEGFVKREEWYESFFDGVYRSSVTRYKYFPAEHNSENCK